MAWLGVAANKCNIFANAAAGYAAPRLFQQLQPPPLSSVLHDASNQRALWQNDRAQLCAWFESSAALRRSAGSSAQTVMEMLDTILRDLKLNETALRRVLDQAPADELRTSDVTLVSHAHGRERRAERGIQRRELQAAIKHGEKVAANPGRRGEKRWRFTHQGVVYITDETMRHEITSWRLDRRRGRRGGRGERRRPAHGLACRPRRGSFGLDAPGRRARLRDADGGRVRQPRARPRRGPAAGAAKAEGMAVTLLEMSDDTVAVFENSALDKGLAKKLRKMGKRRARSHGRLPLASLGRGPGYFVRRRLRNQPPSASYS